MAKRTESSKEKTQKGKAPKKGNHPKSSAKTKKKTDNFQDNKKSARLNFYLIYSVLKKEQGKKFTVADILDLLSDYDIKMTRTTVQRILADVCYDLLVIEETEKLVPFYVYCEIPFDEKIKQSLNKSIEEIIDKKIKDKEIEGIDKDTEIIEAKKYFPITKSEGKDVLELHFPLRLSQYEEEDKEFSAQRIAKKSLVMHIEEPKNITFRCKKYMLNNVVDSFGFEITIEEYDQDWVTVRVDTGLHGAALWLTQYCKDSVAVFPKGLVTEVRKNLREGANNYNNYDEAKEDCAKKTRPVLPGFHSNHRQL